jgi:hypothetical protein
MASGSFHSHSLVKVVGRQTSPSFCKALLFKRVSPEGKGFLVKDKKVFSSGSKRLGLFASFKFALIILGFLFFLFYHTFA